MPCISSNPMKFKLVADEVVVDICVLVYVAQKICLLFNKKAITKCREEQHLFLCIGPVI